MATSPATRVLRHIRNLFAEHRGANLPDRQLLEQFTLRHDQAAFEALLRRHGPLVMGVCRRVLQNGPDAEDAFQATFLVLARKANSIRKKESVGSWLYQTAYHLAVQARATAATRRRHERGGSAGASRRGGKLPTCPHSSAPDVLDQLTARELLSALDEELLGLPERYRAPLVLCYLEGKTRDEAARQLGCSLGTLKRRLEQGRERMRSRLVRRGLALSAALLTTGLTQGTATATIPAPLAAATVQAALLAAAGKLTAGTAISAPAAALAKQALKAMAVSKLKSAVAVLLAVSLAGALTYGAIAPGHPEKPTTQESFLAAAQRLPRVGAPKVASNEPVNAPSGKPGRAKEETGEKMTVTGRILGADGKPVKDAKVAVVSRPRRRLHAWEWANFRFDLLDSARSDSEGRFRLSAPPPSFRVLEPVTPPWPRDETALVVGAPGHGVAWRSLEGELKPSEIVMSLQREQIVRGRLIDLQGQPAAGVQLVVARVASKTPAKDGEGIDFRVPPESLAPWPKPVSTDLQGRFALHGIGPGQSATLEVRDDRFARQHLDVDTGAKLPSEGVSFSLTPARRIIGRVVYADTRFPVPNARLSVWALQDKPYPLVGAVDGRTDAQGRFRINTFPGTSLGVTAFAPEGEPYLNPNKRLEWPKGAVQQEIEVALPRGVLVRGTITEAASGKPVAGATVEFWPYGGSSLDVQSGVAVWITSGPDGGFRMALPREKGHLLVNGPVPDYIPQTVGANDLDYGKPGGTPTYFHAVLPLDLKPEDQTKELPITLRRGVTIKGYLVGPDDKPVARAQMLCGSRPAPLERKIRPLPIWDGRFELRGCDPERTYPVLFLTAPYKPGINGIGVGRRSGQMKLHLPAFFGGKDWLGAAVQLSAKQAGGQPIKVRLVTCGSVVLRLVNGREQLQPLINLSPPLDLVVTPGPYLDEAWDRGVMGGEIVALTGNLVDWNPVAGFKTDTQGRVTLTGLIPGATYRINNLDDTPAKDFTVPSGEKGKPAEITVKIK